MATAPAPSIIHPHEPPLPSPPPPPSHPPPLPSAQIPVLSSKQQGSSSSTERHPVDDILTVGDIVGTGFELQGELITLVDLPTPPSRKGADEPAAQFEVVRTLGKGSYAVVYLVREVWLLDQDTRSDDHCPAGELELEHFSTWRRPVRRRYGREYAIKCLSKANLNKDALEAQLFEATVHQSLPAHPNIVTLYRTLETPSFLLLVLESVPGEDLFYFLEQSRDHQVDSDSENHTPLALSVTPPTPSLLSSSHPSQLLAPGRLRLIASMFAQMCDAVAACHRVNVFHRDIKPENFIVTDAWTTDAEGRRERRVVVKLTDFGLATTETESADMECGSAPYMSFECRNNCAPTYFPRPADVWSLGIVLINMLYHRNPWVDTTAGACPSFDFFLEHPIPFFMQSFTGMTQEVAEFLASKVFCVLDKPDDTRRVSAADFGIWIKRLPSMMGASASNIRRSSNRADVRASARQGSGTSAHQAVSDEHPPVPDLAFSGSSADSDILADEDCSRTVSTGRRRKRGARKGKAAQAAALGSPGLPAEEDHLEQMASVNQDLVRELSRLSNRSTTSIPGRTEHLLPPPPVPPLPSPARKSRWKNLFNSKEPSAEPVEPVSDDDTPRQMSATANHVSNLIMGLSAPGPDADRGRRRERRDEVPTHGPPAFPAHDYSCNATLASDIRSERNASPTSTRSRNAMGPSFQSSNWRNSTSSSASSFAASSSYTRFSNSSMRSVSTTATSLSGSSWRERAAAQEKGKGTQPPPRRPSNVKDMSGIPWELHELPRQCHHDPRGDIFGSPPVQKPPKPSTRRPRAPEALSTISESRPANLTVYTRSDASTSTTGLSPPNSPRSPESASSDGPKKVNKGQITALGKILSSLKSR